MNPIFVSIYAVLILALVATELIGVWRKASGDTLSEGWWWLDRHLPPVARWVLRVLTVGLTGWLVLHLAGPWR